MRLSGRLVDYHVHSTHSCDGRSSISEMCRRALELGLTEIGFSEHMDFDPVDRGYGFLDYEGYTSDIKRAQESFKNRLVIRKGIEIDYQQCFEEDIEAWLRDKEFDFIIGSVHYVNHEIISHQLMTTRDLSKIYDVYFAEVAHSVESGLFDVIGHLDVIRKNMDNRCSEMKNIDYKRSIGTILEEIMRKRVYLEINSKLAVLRETGTGMIPSEEIVNEYIEGGGELISIGSDAHSKIELGKGIKEILSFLAHRSERLRLLFEGG